MGNYYISDIHFGCANKFEGRTLEHDKIIIDNWNDIVHNNDDVYILGDIGRCGSNKDNEYLCKCLSILRGRKHLIIGNHDDIKDARIKQLFVEICDYKEISDNFSGKNYKLVLSHYPILFWNGQHGNKKKMPSIHLFGHLHNSKEWRIYEDCLNVVNKYFSTIKEAGSENNENVIAINCGSMIWDNIPRTLEEMLALYEYKKNYFFNELTYYYVYKHTNIQNDKSYIGITSLKPNDRWRNNGSSYLRKNKDGKFFHAKFASAIQKYGWDNFKHEIIEEGFFTKDEIEEHEIYWIAYYDSYNNGYNTTEGGNISLWSKTDIGKATTSIAVKNLWQDEQYKRSNTTPVKCIDNGYIFKDANEVASLLGIDANGIRSCCRGAQKSAGKYHWEWSNWDDYDVFYEQNPVYLEQFLIEHQKMIEGKEASKVNKEIKKKEKCVLCIDKDIAYQGQVSASIITGIDRAGIGMCCLNKQNTCGGYKWKFIEEDEYTKYKQMGKSDIPIPITRSAQKIPVLCVETNVVYESMAEAYRQTKIKHISECCRGLIKTAGGYHWRIVTSDNNPELIKNFQKM